MGAVTIEIWKFPGKKDKIAITEEIKEGMSVFDLFLDLAKRYEDFHELGFNRRSKGFYPHVVLLLNGRVTGATALLPRILKDGDAITILPYVIGG